MPNRLARWSTRRSNAAWAAVQAASVATLTWFGASLSVWLSDRSSSQFLIVSVGGLLTIAATSWLAHQLVEGRERLTAQRGANLAFVHSQLDALVSREQSDVELKTSVISVPGTPLTSIQRLTTSLYELLESRYQDDTVPGERVHLETCFMTKSYLDGNITISTWANFE